MGQVCCWFLAFSGVKFSGFSGFPFPQNISNTCSFPVFSRVPMPSYKSFYNLLRLIIKHHVFYTTFLHENPTLAQEGVENGKSKMLHDRETLVLKPKPKTSLFKIFLRFYLKKCWLLFKSTVPKRRFSFFMHDYSLFTNATHENGLESFFSRIRDGPNSSKHRILRH